MDARYLFLVVGEAMFDGMAVLARSLKAYKAIRNEENDASWFQLSFLNACFTSNRVRVTDLTVSRRVCRAQVFELTQILCFLLGQVVVKLTMLRDRGRGSKCGDQLW